MTAKILEKKMLEKVIKGWMKSYDLIAPISSKEGRQFQCISDPDEICLNGNRKTIYPPKSVFLPQSEALFKIENGSYKVPESNNRKKIIFGVRPCDARAFWLLDTVFNKSEELDLYWNKKREKAIVISMGCPTLCDHGFCDTVGTGPFGKEGSDILVTEFQESYFLEPLTNEGEELVDGLVDANNTENKEALSIQAGSIVEEHKPADLPAIREKLYASFEKKIWKDISESCLGCGICTYLCPTCFCFDIVDEVDRGERVRNWDTCMFRIYSQEASGHNPRPSKSERTRQRIMHKFAYWIDNESASGCTGCGRCVSLCPVNLDIREMVREITSLRVQ
jgi:sulfhydrogenase subunit beta (sulfur reductase)